MLLGLGNPGQDVNKKYLQFTAVILVFQKDSNFFLMSIQTKQRTILLQTTLLLLLI